MFHTLVNEEGLNFEDFNHFVIGAHLVIVYVKALLLLSLGLDVDSLVVTAGQTILIKRGDI